MRYPLRMHSVHRSFCQHSGGRYARYQRAGAARWSINGSNFHCMSLHDLLQSVLVNDVVHLVLSLLLGTNLFHFRDLRSRQVFQIQLRSHSGPNLDLCVFEESQPNLES